MRATITTVGVALSIAVVTALPSLDVLATGWLRK